MTAQASTPGGAATATTAALPPPGITSDELHKAVRLCTRDELALLQDLTPAEQGALLLAKLLFDGTITA